MSQHSKAARLEKASLLRQQRATLRKAGGHYPTLLKLRRLPDFDNLLRLFHPLMRSPYRRTLRDKVLAWDGKGHPLTPIQRSYL